jgi:hypothetical protein
MKKILVAYGPAGRVKGRGSSIDFNWATPNETVNADRIVCCSNHMCGCDRTFTGIVSRKDTTRAIVIEIDDSAFDTIISNIYDSAVEKCIEKQANRAACHELAKYRQDTFLDLCRLLDKEPVGAIFRIKKDASNRFDLLPFTAANKQAR